MSMDSVYWPNPEGGLSARKSYGEQGSGKGGRKQDYERLVIW
jgi:hypothetical protein